MLHQCISSSEGLKYVTFVVAWIVLLLAHQRHDVNCQMGFDGGVSAASPMIKSIKGWIKERRELALLELHTFPLWGVLALYSNFSLIIGKIIS